MNNSIKNYFQPKPMDSNSEARRASQTGEKVQKRKNITSKKKGNNGRDPLKERKNNFSTDEVKEGPSKSHMQQCEEGQSHSFNFRYKFNKHAVACDTSKTVLDALNTNKNFRKIKKDNKEIVIQRSKGEVPRAAVKSDFPCCLIEKDELLDITFVKNTGDVDKTTERRSFSNQSENFVIFYIKTKGGVKVKRLMKNHELRKKVDDVCVYAFKEEKLKDALRRDGRFIDVIFDKQCALRELGSETIYGMSNAVEHLDRKHFEIIVIKDENEPDSQEDLLSDVSTEMNDEASAADLKENVDPNQQPVNTEQEETQKRNSMKSTNTSNNSFKIIPNSEEILRILRAQFKDLLETLMQRENLKNKTQVQKCWRAEYDKSVEIFSEVYKIKQLMRLSDSVCQIRVEGFARGTGFLLFGQFILTNAHVVRQFLESPDKLSSTKSLEAAFDFERLDSNVKLVRVKKQIAAYCYITDPNKRRLDFALLELDAVDEITGRLELLSCFSPGPPPSRGGICIVGHPEGGIKKMDPCFIIGKYDLQEAADKHISENFDCINVITQRSFEDKWDIYENQMNYHSCFFDGSSGSPVFDEQCKLIGVHTGGYVYPGAKGKNRSIVEYAYSMQSILDMIKAQARIRGLHDIVNILEAYTDKSYKYGTADQENQTDYEMEDAD